MATYKPCHTPMVTSPPLTQTTGAPFNDETLYRKSISGL